MIWRFDFCRAAKFHSRGHNFTTIAIELLLAIRLRHLDRYGASYGMRAASSIIARRHFILHIICFMVIETSREALRGSQSMPLRQLRLYFAPIFRMIRILAVPQTFCIAAAYAFTLRRHDDGAAKLHILFSRSFCCNIYCSFSATFSDMRFTYDRWLFMGGHRNEAYLHFFSEIGAWWCCDIDVDRYIEMLLYFDILQHFNTPHFVSGLPRPLFHFGILLPLRLWFHRHKYIFPPLADYFQVSSLSLLLLFMLLYFLDTGSGPLHTTNATHFSPKCRFLMDSLWWGWAHMIGHDTPDSFSCAHWLFHIIAAAYKRHKFSFRDKRLIW